MKKLIELPHLMQCYDIDDAFWQERSCGIFSLAMVLEHYGIHVGIKDLINIGLKKEGYIKNIGWKHQVIVDIAIDFGLAAKRTEDDSPKNLIEAIDRGDPVIVSIFKHFNNKNGGHLVVLNGYFMDSDGELMGFYINDPIGASFKYKNRFIKINQFANGWKKRAIYIRKSSK